MKCLVSPILFKAKLFINLLEARISDW